MTPMTFCRTALAAALLAAGATAALAQQKLLPQQSEIAFTTKQMGVPVEGKYSARAVPSTRFWRIFRIWSGRTSFRRNAMPHGWRARGWRILVN